MQNVPDVHLKSKRQNRFTREPRLLEYPVYSILVCIYHRKGMCGSSFSLWRYEVLIRTDLGFTKFMHRLSLNKFSHLTELHLFLVLVVQQTDLVQ